MRKIYKLIISLLLPQAAGLLGSVFTIRSVNTWYDTISKPSFNPPNWIFGPVWTTLYILMGLSLYLVWVSDAEKKKKNLFYTLFAIQLVLNTLWSIVFFGLQDVSSAFIVLVMLWVLIVTTFLVLFKIRKKYSLLWIPYILWVSFAGYLNYAIMTLNN